MIMIMVEDICFACITASVMIKPKKNNWDSQAVREYTLYRYPN